MAYKCRINNVVYDLKDSFTIKDELNETLDSGTIQFTIYDGELQAVPFDNVVIYDDENRINKKYLKLDTYADEICSFNNTEFDKDTHEYTVTLFSETKDLERITLPNCSVTQSMIIGAKQKSVYDEILRFYELYVPMVRVYDESSTTKWSFKKEYVLDPEIKTKFENVVCPEFQWNNPTLREVFNDLMSTKDCLVVAKQGIISFYDIHTKGKEIDKSKISRSVKTMSSGDYVGELTIDIKNSLGKSRTYCCEYVSLRTPFGTYMLTTDNGIIETQHPIYSVKKLICYAFDSVENTPSYHHLHKIDITSRIKEKEDFDLLSEVSINSAQYTSLPKYKDDNGLEKPLHKVNFLYFKRGEKEINNFGKGYKIALLADNERFTNIIAETCRLKGTIDLIQDLTRDPRRMFFYIEYEPLIERSMHVGKYLPSEHQHNRMFDNQDNSYVDIEHQSVYEYAKVNRLGNKIRTIYGEFTSESEIPELGDYIGDEILFSREITYYDHQIYFKGMLTPRYVLRDFYTGVLAKKRSWQVAKSNDALTRHDIYKLYVEASFNQKTEYYGALDRNVCCNGLIEIKNAIDYSKRLMHFFIPIPDFYQSVRYGISITEDNENNYYPNQTEGIMIDSDFCVQGMSACFNIGYDDNYISSTYIEVSDFIAGTFSQGLYRYCDVNGEFEIHHLMFVTGVYGIGDGKNGLPKPLEEGGKKKEDYAEYEEMNEILKATFSKPKISIDAALLMHGIGLDLTLDVRKDNREIIQSSLQAEFCSDTDQIIVTKKFVKLSLERSSKQYDYKIYTSDTETYSVTDEKPKGSYKSGWGIKTTVKGEGSVLINVINLDTGANISGASIIGIKSWCLADKDGDILFAVNTRSFLIDKGLHIYFNLLRIRDDKIYADTYGKEVVGDISDTGLTNLQTQYEQRNVEIETENKIVTILHKKLNRDDLS